MGVDASPLDFYSNAQAETQRAEERREDRRASRRGDWKSNNADATSSKPTRGTRDDVAGRRISQDLGATTTTTRRSEDRRRKQTGGAAASTSKVNQPPVREDDRRRRQSRSRGTLGDAPPRVSLEDDQLSDPRAYRLNTMPPRRSMASAFTYESVDPDADVESSPLSGTGDGSTNSQQALTEGANYKSANSADANLVDWAPDDPEHPRNWPKRKKWFMVAWACFMEFGISFASSAYSSASDGLEDEFGVSEPVVVLGLTTFIAGLGLGSIFLAPMSEKFGRNSVYFPSFFIFAIFNMPVALAQNIGTVLVARFFSGFAGSVPLTVTGGTVSDVFAPDDSGFAVALFALAGTAGPAAGPLVSGWIDLMKGWRWVFWVNFIVWMAVWVGTFLFLKETKADILLSRRAARLRRETGNDRLYAPIEQQRISYTRTFLLGVLTPLKLLSTEAIVILMALYNGYVYGLLYLYFEAYPLIFMDEHGFNEGQLGLAYIPVVVGTILGFGAHHWQNKFYLRRKHNNGGKPVPEARLAWALFGGPIFALSLFWFAFTSYPQVSYWAPLMAGVPFGFGILIVYMAAVSFVTDSYTTNGASALAAVSLVRSGMGAAFPIFATGMYDQLGYQYAGLLIACLAVLMSFLAPLFYVFGPAIRKRSKQFREAEAKEAEAGEN